MTRTSIDDLCICAFRIISIGDVQFLRSDQGDEMFKNAWKALAAGDELACAQTSRRYGALPKPRAVIIDVRVPLHLHS